MTQARHRFRLYPTTAQRSALARGFGCCRVVFNDVIALREQRYRDGLPHLADAEISRLVTTVAKRTPERSWLADVSASALQSAVRDANAAYRSFFDAKKGKRRGGPVGRPRFRSRRDRRQTMRFTRAARFRITSKGRLRLQGIRQVKIVWSRDLPSDPSSVTVITDAAGRYFASFVNAARVILAAGLAERRNGCGTVEDLFSHLREKASVQPQAQHPAGDCEEAAITTAARQVAASGQNLPRSVGREGQLRGSTDE